MEPCAVLVSIHQPRWAMGPSSLLWCTCVQASSGHLLCAEPLCVCTCQVHMPRLRMPLRLLIPTK